MSSFTMWVLGNKLISQASWLLPLLDYPSCWPMYTLHTQGKLYFYKICNYLPIFKFLNVELQ